MFDWRVEPGDFILLSQRSNIALPRSRLAPKGCLPLATGGEAAGIEVKEIESEWLERLLASPSTQEVWQMHERFCTYLADTLDAQHLHHHLRYKVYCQRKRFEAGALVRKLPQERDKYDSVAARFVVKDVILDSWIGTARLVPNDDQPLPAQTLGAIDSFNARLLAEHKSAEVSRLASVSAYPSAQCNAQLLRSVILGVLGHSHGCGIEWLVFLVSPGLARMLDRIGVPMEPCGDEITHRGARRAYRSHVESGIDSAPWARPIRRGNMGYESFSGQQLAAA